MKKSSVSDTSEASDEKASELEEEADRHSSELEEEAGGHSSELEEEAGGHSSLKLVGRGFRPSIRREAIRRKLQQAKKKVSESTLVPELDILISVG